MKKLLLILLCFPLIGFGQIQYKLDSITLNLTDSVTHNLTSVLMHTFYYDTQGRCNTSFKYGNGVILAKSDHTYDVNNNIIESYESVFDSTTLDWDTISRYIYTYDMSNNLIELVYQYWNGIQWENNFKNLFYYNLSNEITNQEHFQWDSLGNQWALGWCIEYAYQSGKPIMGIKITNSCVDTTSAIEWSYLGNNLSYSRSLSYIDSTNTFIFLGSQTNWFCNSTPLINTAIPTFFSYFYDIPYDFFENQIDSIISPDYQGTFKYHYSTYVSASIQENTLNKKILRITDLLGRETKGKKNEPLFYIYDDGTVEKRIVIE